MLPRKTTEIGPFFMIWVSKFGVISFCAKVFGRTEKRAD
jgi:hypothetical protein